MEPNILSTVEGIDWPALPDASAAARLALLFQLEKSQWWSPETLREQQLKQVKRLLHHCVTQVPHYRNTLHGLIPPETLSEEEWSKIPILTRGEVQQYSSQLVAEQYPRGHGQSRAKRTSGSTGKPIETRGTELTGFFWRVFTLREHLWHQRDLGGKLAVIRYTEDETAVPPHGSRSSIWGRSTTGLYETGPSVLLSIFTPISEQVTWLQKEAPDYILTHPSIIQDLALYCLREGIQLPSLREIRTISEMLPDGLRELCQKVWGIRLVDTYSTIELGYLAFQCPSYEHYHVQSEGVLLEILDDAGKPCAPGETGRVIVTDLHNYVFPLIRYEVGDYAEVGEPCACGRGLPVIKRIHGRYRNLLTMPSGERHYPRLGIQDLHEIAPVQQFQAVQHTLNEIEIRLIMPRPIEADEKEKLTSLFKKMMGDYFTFEIRQVESLQRSASGKYEEFISAL